MAETEAQNISSEEDDNDVILDTPEPPASSGLLSKKPRISKTKKFTNPVHQWYTDDGDNSRCNVCSQKVPGRHGTNLTSHLKNHHPTEYEKVEKEKEASASARATNANTQAQKRVQTTPTITDCFRRITERKDGWKRGSDSYKKAIRSIAIAFVSNSLPYQLIEDQSMKQMFASVSDGRLIELPRRQELAANISALTGELKSSITAALRSVRYVSLTLDLWSRPGNASAMMGITGHYYDSKLNGIRRILLACRTIKQPHTGENIYNIYNLVRGEWDLKEEHILRIVTDNGSNVVKAFK